MIKEDYVSFETAKLLKDKGFDEPCYAYWSEDENRVIISQSIFAIQNITNPCFFGTAAPTLQMAMKWLREKYNLHIITLPYAPMDRYAYHPDFEADMVYIAQLFKGIIPKDEIGRKVIKLTHEEACDAAIKYCLENLI